MKLTELLPIGSVVLLTGAKKKLMIYGIGQTNEETGETYDYIGVMYPEGSMGEGTQFLFNHPDIQEIVFRGYEDAERTSFLSALQGIYDSRSDE